MHGRAFARKVTAMNVMFGAAFAALIIGAVLVRFWPAIAAMESGLAAFLGALVGAAAGLGAILAGALYNAKLNRRRDAELRKEEELSIANALYGEILLLREEVAKVARVVARVEERREEITQQLVEDYRVRDPILYPALAHRLGLLPADLLLAISKFYGDYWLAGRNLPLLVREERGFSYSPASVLKHAVSAVDDIEPTLRKIEALTGSPEARKPDTGNAPLIVEMYEEQLREHRSGA